MRLALVALAFTLLAWHLRAAESVRVDVRPATIRFEGPHDDGIPELVDCLKLPPATWVCTTRNGWAR